ncbi:MAG TPA: MurT ligase domain-containing protein [Solirubrobacteraceae bacterium]|jgi:UDP-N-acetylmuramyl tripeptide synthase|nr:MurT ligase domain-containing protein [Solirubrobacteraceae bacterium]
MLFSVKRSVARSAGALSRLRGGGGTSIPGAVLLRLEPRAIARLAGDLRDGSVIVSATNGKTTTAAMLASVMEQAELNVVHNRAGANMAGGIASALLEARGRGTPPAEIGLFEVDEFYVPQVADQLGPRAILLGNLFRDQLDRYGELETIADRWAAVVARSTARLVLNADDPLIADLGRDAPSAVYFGVDDASLGRGTLGHAADSKHCRRCGTAYDYTVIYLGHLGVYSCPGCGAGRPAPQVSGRAISLDGVHGASFDLVTPVGTARVELPLPGLYNVYNALGAAALAAALEIPLDLIVRGLAGVAPAFGRAESVSIGGRELCILLVKNPTGANEVLRTLALEPGDHDLLGALNDQTADGHDVSWIWDADFEPLAPRIRRATCSGTRAAELALRLKYAGVPADRIRLEPELADALDRALADGGGGTLYALPTYTAMLELRALLARRGAAASSWALA